MPKEKSITRVLLWQTAGRFALQGISFITAPIFTRLLTPSDYGQFAVYSTWVSLFSLIIGLQTHGSIANAKVKYADEKINGYLSSIMTLSVISFIILFCLVIVFNSFFARFLALRSDLVILLVIESFAAFCIAFYIGKLIQYKKAEQSTLISVFLAIITTGLSLILLLNIKENRYIVRIYAHAIPIIIAGLIIVIYIYFKGKKLINFQYWKYCLLLTIPTIFHGAASIIIAQSDRIMLQRIVGESYAGIYSISYTLALVIATIWTSFNVTWVPFYYEYKKNNDNDLILLRTKNYTIIFTIITMGFVLLAPEVFRIIAPREYWSGIKLMPLIAMAYYFNFLYSFPANFEFYKEKTILIAMGTIFAAIINVIFNLFLIPIYAGIGAAIASLISFVSLFIFHEIVARFVIKNYENKLRLYLTGLMPVGIIVVIFYFIQELWYVRWGIGLVLGVYLLRRIIKNKAIF